METRLFRITLPANVSTLEQVRHSLAEQASHHLSAAALHELILAVDEACTNVIRHGFKEDPTREYTVEIELRSCSVVVGIWHDGPPFEPPSIPPATPDLRQSLLQRKRGGLGMSLIYRLTDAVEYRTRGTLHGMQLTKRTGER